MLLYDMHTTFQDTSIAHCAYLCMYMCTKRYTNNVNKLEKKSYEEQMSKIRYLYVSEIKSSTADSHHVVRIRSS